MTLAAPQTACPSNQFLDQATLEALVAQTLEKLDTGLTGDAIALIGDIQAIAPGDAVALHLLGLASFRLEEPGKAKAAFESAHQIAPDVREYAEALSIVCAKLGSIADSLFYAKLATASTRHAAFPDLLPAWFGNFEESFFKMADDPIMKRAAAAVADQNWQAAMLIYRKATEVTPDALPAWRGLVDAFCELDQPYEAIPALQRVRQLSPDDPKDFTRYARTFELAGHWQEAFSAAHAAATSAPHDAPLGWQEVRLRFAQPGSERDAVAESARLWAEQFAPPAHHDVGATMQVPLLDQRRLKLGVFSSHWIEGDGLDLIEPLLAALPKRSVELYVYADDLARSALAIRVRGFSSHWQEVADLDDDTIAFMLANDTLDVLIDLDGPLRRKRYGLFARHPVACMLSVSDLPETAASVGFDGVVGDEYFYAAEPSGAVLSLPGLLTLASDQSASPARSGERTPEPTLFGTLAPRREITVATVALWSQILRGVPGSRLHLMLERMGGASGVEDVVGLFDTGLVDRIVLVTGNQAVGSYVADIDILLDPIDGNYPEETVAATVAGVPAITLPGALPARRLLGGWLTRLGMSELVATDAPSYAAAAIRAADPNVNGALRDRLIDAAEGERKNSAADRAQALEAGLRRMVKVSDR